MTSIGTCLSCQGEVVLYEEEEEYTGQKIFRGYCYECNHWVTEYPRGYDPYKAEEEWRLQSARRWEQKDIQFAEEHQNTIRGWCWAGRQWSDFPRWSARIPGDTDRYFGSYFYEDEARYAANEKLEDGQQFYVRRGQFHDLKGTHTVDKSANPIRLEYQYMIPYHAYAEDGTWFEERERVPSMEIALDVLKRYMWDDLFKFKIIDNDGSVLLEGRREQLKEAVA
jgi:hypothetical protein